MLTRLFNKYMQWRLNKEQRYHEKFIQKCKAHPFDDELGHELFMHIHRLRHVDYDSVPYEVTRHVMHTYLDAFLKDAEDAREYRRLKVLEDGEQVAT